MGSVVNQKAKDWIVGRKDWQTKLEKKITGDNWLWFHCSSLGEFEDFREVLERIRTKNESMKILLTFYSPSGYNAMRDYQYADVIAYLPLDTTKNAKKFLDVVRPKAVFFSRSDLWYNFLREIKSRGIKSYLVGLSLTVKSNFLRWPMNKIYRKCFNSFTLIFCQNEQTKSILLTKFECPSIVVGNTRMDRVGKLLNDEPYPEFRNFIGDKFCVIAGSCLRKDEKLVIRALHRMSGHQIKWIIVPHEINEKAIEKTIRKSNLNAITFLGHEFDQSSSAEVMYVNSVGALKHLYRYANLAIIGGGFNKIGIHNILEPSIFGVPVTFGPNHRNYSEALELLELDSAHIHRNLSELCSIIERYYAKKEIGESNTSLSEYIPRNSGASEKITSLVKI